MVHGDDVLVGIDGSESSLNAAQWAASYARIHGLGLHLVCAYAVPSFTTAALDGGYAALDDTAIAEGAKGVLDEAKALVARYGGPVTGTVATGDAAAVLIEMSHHARIAVVGTRGRGGFTERLLGTVSSALPAHAACPTVVVPFRPDAVEGATDGAVTDAVQLRRIVVGVDGSPAAEFALQRAVREAEVWGAELTAITGVPVAAGAGLLAWLPAAVDRDAVLRDVAEGLDVVVDRALVDHPEVTVERRTVDGTGAQQLMLASAEADLLVVGSRGRGGFAGMLLGSTSQAVLHHSACPVMVVTARGEDGA